MGFLDIDQILSEEERLPCTFKCEAYKLGYLDPSTTERDLPESTRVELPLWLAQQLKARNMVDLDMPKHFGPKMRNELASSSNINLREYSFYFFDVGMQLSRAMRDDDLSRTLRVAFTDERFRSLMVHSLTTWHDDVAEYSQSLTSSELKIFNEALKASRDVGRWRVREGSLLQSATLGKKSSRLSVEASSKRPKFGI